MPIVSAAFAWSCEVYVKILAAILFVSAVLSAVSAHADWKPVYKLETYAIAGTTGETLYRSIGERGQVDFGANYDLFRFVFPKTDIKSTLDVIPILSESGRVRIDFDTRISYEVFKDFTLSLRFWDNFDSRNPSSGVKENDYGLSFGLGYKF